LRKIIPNVYNTLTEKKLERVSEQFLWTVILTNSPKFAYFKVKTVTWRYD